MMKRAAIVFASVVAALLVVAIIVGLAIYAHREEQKAIADFRSDLQASQFVLLGGPGIENPVIEHEDDDAAVEAMVILRGCRVELERSYPEKAALTRAGTRVEVYELDELFDAAGNEINFTSDPPASPTPDQVATFMNSYTAKLAYCLDKK